MSLATFSVEITEDGLNEILARVGEESTVDVPPLVLDTRILGKLVLEGTVTVSDMRVTIAGSTGTASARAVPSFTLEYSTPGNRSLQVPLDVSFRLERVSASLEHDGAKALMVLSDLDVALELERPSLVPQRVWSLVRGQLGRLRTLVRTALNAALRQRPIKLFDLSNHGQIPLPGDKVLETTLEFETLEFRGGALRCTILLGLPEEPGREPPAGARP